MEKSKRVLVFTPNIVYVATINAPWIPSEVKRVIISRKLAADALRYMRAAKRFVGNIIRESDLKFDQT